MRLSYWERSELERSRDVIIVGAGLVGMSAAIELKRKMPDSSITVIDRQVIGCAASTRNAGFACFGSVSEILADIEVYGEQATIDLINRRRSGIQSILRRFNKEELRFEYSGGYEIFDSKDSFSKCEQHVEQVNKLLDSEVFEVIKTPSPIDSFRNCIFNRYEGQLDTGRLYNALVKEGRSVDIEMIRGIKVSDIDLSRGHLFCQVEDINIDMKAHKIIVATNSLTTQLFPQLDVEPVRNQVIVSQELKGHGLKGCFHQDQGYIYFRDIGNRVLIGGARHLHKEEETSQFGKNPENQTYLLNHLRKCVLPHIKEEIKIDQSWSGILSGGAYRLPIVEKLSENVTIAVRLSGMGVAIGIDVGVEAATLALL